MQKKKTPSRKQRPTRKPREPKRRPQDRFFGQLKGEIQIIGDIVSPITPIDDWEALKD
jgi:hypothetical protein